MTLYSFLMAAMLMVSAPTEDSIQPIDQEHFLIYGFMIEKVYGSDNEANAPDTRCIVYRDNEIYVAFKSSDKGEYIFNLPLGHEYTLEFGGEDFVNKRVVIDTKKCKPKKKKGHVVEMDMSLFRPVDGIDYKDLEQQIVRWYYDNYEKAIVPDLEVLDGMWRTVERLYKKSEKEAIK